MKALVFGSLNIDKVYFLEHLPERGETLSCSEYEIHVGGKGLNQAVSLAKAGVETYMAGQIGADGKMLTDFLSLSGVNTDFVSECETPTGHAVIEVDGEGQNQMILFGGANRKISENSCDKVLESFSQGDLILMQYETSCVEYMIKKAHGKGMKTALNPSPYVKEINALPFEMIDFLVLNESEGQSITGKEKTEDVITALKTLMPGGAIILTLGAKGAVYADKNETVRVNAFKVNAVDTTGAGDTFTGYCLAELMKGTRPEKALRFACGASAIAVTKSGAAETIPDLEEVVKFHKTHTEV